jgi:hypothetical protein
MKTVGTCVSVGSNEELMHAVTALGASGPAFMFVAMEALVSYYSYCIVNQFTPYRRGKKSVLVRFVTIISSLERLYRISNGVISFRFKMLIGHQNFPDIMIQFDLLFE